MFSHTKNLIDTKTKSSEGLLWSKNLIDTKTKSSEVLLWSKNWNCLDAQLELQDCFIVTERELEVPEDLKSLKGQL